LYKKIQVLFMNFYLTYAKCSKVRPIVLRIGQAFIDLKTTKN